MEPRPVRRHRQAARLEFWPKGCQTCRDLYRDGQRQAEAKNKQASDLGPLEVFLETNGNRRPPKSSSLPSLKIFFRGAGPEIRRPGSRHRGAKQKGQHIKMSAFYLGLWLAFWHETALI